MEPIDPVTAAMLMGRRPDPCEPILEISRKVLTRLMDVVEFGDQMERVEKDRLLVLLKDMLAAEQPELWAMHCVGPCEVHPMISKEEADRNAAELIALCKERCPDVPITVDVIPSPFSPLEHFEILAEELAEQVASLRQALDKKNAEAPAPTVVNQQLTPAARLPVVLPERANPNEHPAAMLMRATATGWNSALDEVARLNSAISNAASDILAERQRQITAEGWTPDHDAEHDGGELAAAGAAYALHAADHLHPYSQGDGGDEAPDCWPWHNEVAGRGEGPVRTVPAWWKPGTPRRDLIKAAALILAEIERLDRAAEPKVLKAYQVGDNDIVAAYDPAGAIQVLVDFAGYGDDFDVEPVSDKVLDATEAFDQDEGKAITLDKTLRQQLAELTEPAYLHGWE
ncbi:hypothetical protein [Pseudomonas indica]|uniref:hypothetical protein n=1 Tax=Pseudomonas indica TaxID=137658 RepID=UPI003FD43F93